MNTRERKEMNGLTREFIRKIEELFNSYRIKVVEAIEKEEEKAEKIEEYFPSSSRQEEIQEDIDSLEDTLSVFSEAVDMITEVDYV